MNISLLFNYFLGETSPLIAGRIDTRENEMGARRMENLIPMLTGGIRKRPGTWYDGTTNNNLPARLIDWLLSDGSCILIELSAGATRVWREADTQEGKYRVTQTLANGYTAEQIEGIQYAASANNLWLVHQARPPLKLAWSGSAVTEEHPSFTGKDFTSEGSRPGAVAFDAGRLCFAGTANEPNRIYLSRPPDSMTGQDRYTDFTAGDNPADAIVLEENDMHGSRIQWIAANRRLLAATGRATWSDTGEVPTPATFDMNIIEYAGADGIQPRGTKEIMVYAGRGGKTLRALVWNQDSQGSGFIDTDISDRAAHLFTAGVKDLAVSDYPYPVIWIVTGAGELISCTVNIRAGVLAYARHPTEGSVEAVASAPQKTGDVVFLAVKRGEARNVEHLILEDLVSADYAESHYVDAGESRAYAAPAKILTGLQRFAGKSIRVFADGAAEPPVRVDEGGAAELQNSVTNVHLGLAYRSVFVPNTRVLPANGTSKGKKHRIEKVTIQLYKSLGGRAGTDEAKTEQLITQRLGGYVLGSAPEPFTGDIDVTVSGTIDTEGKLVIVHEDPAPFTLLSLVERVAILEA
ncbi:MAG: hypothetical protein LBG26_03065 [Treponema sp.]|jgi:hypothetical protein|nr:hypothetical protein [Treponema sp.]